MSSAAAFTVVPAPASVHLWVVHLDSPCFDESGSRLLLAPEERARADRFVFDRDRRHYVVCRANLRRLLAAYLDAEPRGIAFAYGTRGKPRLRRGQAGPDLQFNVSHAAGLAVCAFMTGAEIGVDVESGRRTVDFASLAERFFSAEESTDLLNLPAPDRRTAFFNCWTRKEAYIKAIGDGLYCPLDAFSVTLRPDDAVRMRTIGEDRAEAARWTVRAFEPAAGYVGAFAVRTPVRDVILRTVDGAAGRMAFVGTGSFQEARQ